MAEASACSCARAESSWATAESCAAWAESRSLLAMSCRAKSSVFRPRSRLVSTTATCAFAVCALASAWAARAFATSARERSICACWLRTAALAESRSALAWFTFASKISGSIRAITSPWRTTELKSADSCVIWPEIWLPTWTVITALRLPVAETAAARRPRSTRANRYAGALAPPTDEYAQTPAPTRDSRKTRDRTRFVRSARMRGDRAPNRTGLSASARSGRGSTFMATAFPHRRALGGGTLQLTEAPVPTTQRDQLLVGPALNESALFEDEDQIGLRGRLEVVGDEQAGFPGHEAPERFPNPGLAFDIEARRRLVQDQDRRVADDGPGQGDPLFLPAREGTATLGDHGGVAVVELDDEIMGVGRLGGAHDFRNRGVGLAIRNVLLDAGGQQHRILRNDTDVPAEGLASIPLDVGPIDQDGSPDRVVEAEDQAGDRGLAGTGRSHQHHPLTGGDRERHMGQHAPPVAVVERDVVEDDLALELRRVDRVGHVADAGFDIEDLRDPVDAHRRLRKLRGQLREASDRLVHVGHVRNADEQLARHQGPVQHLERPEEDGGTGRDGTEHLHTPGGGRLDARRPDPLLKGLSALGGEALLFVALQAERLHEGHRAQDLAHSRGHAPLVLSLALGGGLELSVEVVAGPKQNRKGRQDDQAQPPVHGEHNREHADEREQLTGDRERRDRDEILQGAGIAGDLRQELARPCVRVEGQRQALEMGQELPSQGVGEFDPDARGDEELAVRQRPPEDGDAEDGEGHDDERDDLSAVEQSVEKRQGRRERFVEQDLVENQL